jgi:hypothetical protein
MNFLSLIISVIWITLLIFIIIRDFRNNSRRVINHFTYWVLIIQVIFFAFLIFSERSKFDSSGKFKNLLWQLSILILIGAVAIFLSYGEKFSPSTSSSLSSLSILEDCTIHILPIFILFLTVGLPSENKSKLNWIITLALIIGYLLFIAVVFNMNVLQCYEITRIKSGISIYLFILIAFLLSCLAVWGLSWCSKKFPKFAEGV